MAVFVLRLLLYQVLAFSPTPWLVLVIELLQGATFALGWSAGCLYVKRTAPRGTRATVQRGAGGHMFALMAAVLLLAWALGLGAGLLASKRAAAAHEAAAHEPAPETRLLAALPRFGT
ncbi:hypothetical protein QBZ16_003454 [Prototheca wickerhamii]|uniref:Major facilitator superfamily associated domain-containing protein n=1 Tax=Prototheca wickerhamii TaxID=3111 RepID=A0AAD9MHI3_PROWI|nr:hypothetical protein QBZ16_003454 [Prototheca wickerhamii]